MAKQVEQIDLGYTPRPWQAKCHMEMVRHNVLALHRRAGKTVLGVRELVNAALLFDKELGGFFYIAPELKQARAIAWKMLKAAVEPLRRIGAVEVREGDLAVVFRSNKSTITLYGADNPDAMRGMRMDGVVIDEVADIKPEVWTDIVQPALSDRLGWALFIGTPHGINLFSELFSEAQKRPGWRAEKFTVYDTDALDPAEVERLRNEMPPKSFAREYLCDFSASGDDQLISLTDVEQASIRTYTERDLKGMPRIVGVDPARFGGDRSVIVRRQGLQIFPPQVFNGLDNMELAARVVDVIESWKPDAVFIDSGAGAGVIDRLRQLGHSPVEVPFGGRANKTQQFVNRRVEMWWAMRDWLRSGGAIPRDASDLRKELATPVYWADAAGRWQLESKDDIKKRLPMNGSPDEADAAVLTFASPVRIPSEREREMDDLRQTPRKREGHDPYAFM